MTAEDILQALHQAAMGRARTPQQIELAEKLEALFATKRKEQRPGAAGLDATTTAILRGEVVQEAAFRTRKQKAD